MFIAVSQLVRYAGITAPLGPHTLCSYETETVFRHVIVLENGCCLYMKHDSNYEREVFTEVHGKANSGPRTPGALPRKSLLCPSHGRTKRSMCFSEPGRRVPLSVTGPGVVAGTVCGLPSFPGSIIPSPTPQSLLGVIIRQRRGTRQPQKMSL